MNKIYLFISFYFGCISFTYSQNNELSNCLITCDKTVIVKEGGFLGVKTIPACDKDGALIMEVVSNSPAEHQNLQARDFIVKLADIDVFGPLHFKKLINSYKPNDVVKLSFIRNNVLITQDIIIGALTTRVETKKVCCDDVSKDAFGNSFSILPVPANDKITIQSNLLSGNYSIEIYNPLGVLIKSINGTAKGNLLETIDVNSFPEGSYIVMINNNGRVASKNIIIKH